VSGSSLDDPGFTLTWVDATSANNFADASTITGAAGTVFGNNVGANKEAGEPNHAGNTGGASVWYRWQAPFTGKATFFTTTSNLDTLLGVYTGSAVNSLTTIASNDDGLNLGLQSTITFNIASGANYYIAVDGFNGATGIIKLSWTASSPPANDNFANAQVVSGPSGFVSGSNAGATKEPGEPNHGGNPGGSSVWYRWTAPNSDPLSFYVSDSTFTLGAYTGSSVSSLTTVGGGRSSVSFTPVTGTLYYIAVDGFNGATGSFGLQWQKNVTTPTPTPTPSPTPQLRPLKELRIATEADNKYVLFPRVEPPPPQIKQY